MSGLKDSPEARLLYAISEQAIRDMVAAQVKINWRTDDDLPLFRETVRECMRYLAEDSPFAEDERYIRLIREVNASILLRAIAKDRMGRLSSYHRDVERAEKIDRDIAALEKKRSEVQTHKDKVQASQYDFPYIQAHVTVDVEDPAEVDALNRRLAHKRKDAAFNAMKRADVLAFMDWLEEGDLKDTIRAIYIERTKKQSQAAKELGISSGRLSQKVTEELIDYAKEKLIPIPAK